MIGYTGVVRVSFSLSDQSGNQYTEADFAGRYLVVYFYPKDDTPGCTKEACTYRDMAGELKNLGAAVVGVSKDSIKSHAKFAEKFKLNFPLLVDEGAKFSKQLGAWGEKKFMGKTFEGVKRNTYLFGPDGTLIKAWENVDPVAHVDEVISEIKAAQK